MTEGADKSGVLQKSGGERTPGTSTFRKVAGCLGFHGPDCEIAAGRLRFEARSEDAQVGEIGRILPGSG
ncbi:hypothetical protein AOLI_G00023840 [Acnodon oligacanthus]